MGAFCKVQNFFEISLNFKTFSTHDLALIYTYEYFCKVHMGISLL